ncbi:MAG: HD domain-containing protein [Firmicutes bacterium]|nr:HD domain-containing protein [Bacillota bacterium]
MFRSIDEHLVCDEKPSVFLNKILGKSQFSEYPFEMMRKQAETEQSPKHHPEGNVWNHTMLVVDEAASRKEESTNERVFMWAAFLHDIGKPPATKTRKGKITAYDHDRIGEELARDFLSFFNQEKEFISSVAAMVRWHMQILYVLNDLPFGDASKMKRQVNIQDIALLNLCDALGRGDADKVLAMSRVERFLEEVKG